MEQARKGRDGMKAMKSQKKGSNIVQLSLYKSHFPLKAPRGPQGNNWLSKVEEIENNSAITDVTTKQ